MRSLKEILKDEMKEDLAFYVEDLLDEEIKNKKDVIPLLEQKIKENFKDFVESEFNFDYLDTINQIKKCGESDTILEDELIDRNFLFFKDENLLEFPKDLDDILKSTFDKERQKKLLQAVIICYLDINRVIPKEFINKNYIEKFSLDISLEGFNDDFDFSDEFIYVGDLEDANMLYKEYKDVQYRILSNEELFATYSFNNEFIKKITGIVKDKQLSFDIDTFLRIGTLEEPSMIPKNLMKNFSISKKSAEKITKMYLKDFNKFRFIIERGRNMSDLFLDKLKSDAPNLKDKKEFTIEKLFKLTEMDEHYDINKESVLDYYETLKEIDFMTLCIKEEQPVEYDTFEPELITSCQLGIVYLDNKYQYLMPIELREIIDNHEKQQEKLEKKYENLFEIEDTIRNYIDMNGLISIDKLIELLDKNDIHLNKVELQELADYKRIKSIDEYLVDSVFETKDLFDVIKDAKDEKEEYKILNPNEYVDLKDELENILVNEDIEYERCLINELFYCIQFNAFNKKELNNLLRQHDITLSNSKLDDIFKKMDNLSKITSRWDLNGFSEIDVN